MEYMLLPNDVAVPHPRVPYICEERYDGLPWLSYPVRKAKAEPGFSVHDYVQSESRHPTPPKEQESFLQTWLFFGLLAEFMGLNATETPELSTDLNISIDQPKSVSGIEVIYNTLVLQERDGCFVCFTYNDLMLLTGIAKEQVPTNAHLKLQRQEHLLRCLYIVYEIFFNLGDDFDHNIKFSISALCEVLFHSLDFIYGEIPRKAFWRSGTRYFTPQVKTSMIANGWCPSDISRAEVKYQSVQTLYMLRMMGRLPKEDHNQCSEYECKLSQIVGGQYHVGHQEIGCPCQLLSVDYERLLDILDDGDAFPLLKFTGGLEDLKVELISSATRTPYVAISHVWADGLGNPDSNSLYKCKITRLLKLVAELHEPDVEGKDTKGSECLIWLDTLCCPAKDSPGKTKAIEKIRLVYKQAKYVLVLDSSLMAYQSNKLSIAEQQIRVFTSRWMRRLWTLQEGALAPSLYFQFADIAIALNCLKSSQRQLQESDVRYRAIKLDLGAEISRLEVFFSSNISNNEEYRLSWLDQALQYRNVSVASDEALCIATLLSLDLNEILSVPKTRHARMQKVWQLVSSTGGIPAQIIFFEERRMQEDGWRWAPESLLRIEKGLFNSPSTRCARWVASNRGRIREREPRGLEVNFTGYLLKKNKYDDGNEEDPWRDIGLIEERRITFRDPNKQWFEIADVQRMALMRDGYPEQKEQYKSRGDDPLHKLATTDKTCLILSQELDSVEYFGTIATYGVLATVMEANRKNEIADGAILVRTECQVIVTKFSEEDCVLYNKFEDLALGLRCSDLAMKYQQILDRDSEEFEVSRQALLQKMANVVMDAMAEDPKFAQAVKGNVLGEYAWNLLRGWFRDDYVGIKVPDDQLWIVD